MRWLLLLFACGCSFRSLSFQCAVDGQCGTAGRCISGGCALPSASCASGLEWDPSAGRGGCVDPPDIDMATPDFSVADLMAPLANGEPCTAGKSCESGQCSDGVCCDAPCNGLCLTCAGGHCRPAAAGSDARDDCMPDGTACGLDGQCDGAGGCRKRTAGTVCAAQSCTAGTLTRAAVCDGKGDCQPPTTRPCAPYQCAGDDCTTTCSGDGGCAPPNSCVAGSCGLAPAGAPCTSASQCITGFCADGVCCDGTCSGACRSCALPGSEGICTTVAAGGSDPHAICVDQGASSCGQTGLCGASGACALYAAGTVCRPAACTADSLGLTTAATCAGGGAPCGSGTSFTCGHYRCFSGTSGPFCANFCGCCLCAIGQPTPPWPEYCAPGYTCTNHCGGAGSSWTCD